MATARPQLPSQPRGHSYGLSSNAPIIGNTSLPTTYEGYIITPSESRDEDVTSQDRWTRARSMRFPATEKGLEVELDMQSHPERKAQEDLRGISIAKRDQIMGVIESRERSNPGFTYRLVALKLEPGYAPEKSLIHRHDHKHKDSLKKKRSTAFMQMVLQRIPAQRQGVIPLVAGFSSLQSVASSSRSTEKPSRTPRDFVPLGTHIKTSLPQYLPSYLQHNQKHSDKTSTFPSLPAAQSQAGQQVQHRPPNTISRRRESNMSQDDYPPPSSSSSSLDSAYSAPPRRTKSTIYHVGSGSSPTQHSGYGIGRPSGANVTPMTPWPSPSTPRGNSYGQVTPIQATYQQSCPAQPRSEYPFPSFSPRSYVSMSTQTDLPISASSQHGNGATGKVWENIRGKVPEILYHEDDHAGSNGPKDLASSGDDITIIEESDEDDSYSEPRQPPEKGVGSSTKHERPAWMDHLVPVTPPAVAEGFLDIPRRRSNPMSPIVEDAVDDCDSQTVVPRVCKVGKVIENEHDLEPSATMTSDENPRKPTDVNTNPSYHTGSLRGRKDHGRAEPTRKPSPEHGILRSQNNKNHDTNNPVSSLRKSSSYERPNPDSRRSSASSTAEPEYFTLRPNDYAEAKPRSPTKRVTFSLPPSPSYGTGSRSTSPGETPPSSPHSASSTSPTIKLLTPAYTEKSGIRPPPPKKCNSYNPPPSNPVIIDGSVCRPPLHRQSQSSSSYSPKERSPARAKDGNTVHLSSAPASFANLEKYEKDQRRGGGKVRYEHFCPYALCKGLAFGLKEDLRDHEYSVHRKGGRR